MPLAVLPDYVIPRYIGGIVEVHLSFLEFGPGSVMESRKVRAQEVGLVVVISGKLSDADAVKSKARAAKFVVKIGMLLTLVQSMSHPHCKVNFSV